jgi:hypothetical protein
MDKTFVRDMWTICKDHDTAIQDAGNRWNNLVTTIQTHSPDTALREVTPPSFLDLKWPQANASIGCEIPAPVGT